MIKLTPKTLKTIIDETQFDSFDYIEFRCEWETSHAEYHDDFIGAAKYSDGKLIPFDGDSYSLDDIYHRYGLWTDGNGGICLTVWERADAQED